MSPVRKTTTNGSSGSGSRVDASQKPNCRSPVQGLERQGLRRHLPSRSSVRAELRDGNTFFATGWRFCVLSIVSSLLKWRMGSPLYAIRLGKPRATVQAKGHHESQSGQDQRPHAPPSHVPLWASQEAPT